MTKPSDLARLCLLLASVLGATALLAPCARASARPALGANVDLSAMGTAERKTTLDRLAAAGVTSVRMELDWNRVEPKQGKFAWAPFDAAVEAARARGMDVMLVLGPCASWAVSPARQVPPDQRRWSVPRSAELWRRYVKAAVLHFRSRVHLWQVREQPNAHSFRGSRSEYLALLEAAAKVVRSLDPKAVVVAPETGFLDIAAIERFAVSASGRSADAIGLYLPADTARAALPWAVLSQEIAASAPRSRSDRGGGPVGLATAAVRGKPIWVLGAQEGASADAGVAGYLLAWAFGCERCYLRPEAIDSEWSKPLAKLSYLGFANPAPGAWMLFFTGPEGEVAAAWSSTTMTVPRPHAAVAGELSPDAGEAPEGMQGTSSVSSPAPELLIGPRPLLMAAGEWLPLMRAGAPTRADVLAARGGADLAGLPMVYMDCSLVEHPELGLLNRGLRGLAGGACIEEQRQGRGCIRTSMTYLEGDLGRDNPWLYFDVDDSWLYYARGKTRVAVTVECQGSYLGSEELGFNIAYDSTKGYRFSRWQWVEPGYEWRSYRVELDDVSFANRDGWDFRINAKGSTQDLWVSAVTVEKVVALGPLPRPEPQASAAVGPEG